VPFKEGEGNIYNNHVHAIAFDSEGNIWVGHMGRGVSQFRNADGKWINHRAEKGTIGGDVVYAITVRKADAARLESVWFATSNGVSSYASGTWKTYRSKRAADGSYPNAELLPETVNAPGSWNFNPFISNDGKTLVFTSQRRGGAGKGDIWVSQIGASGDFEAPRNLGPLINSADEEFHATISPDKKALFFVRRPSGVDAQADLYWVSTKDLGI
jgi:Tol biopolymer transport system component